jgi:hypothetical protein
MRKVLGSTVFAAVAVASSTAAAASLTATHAGSVLAGHAPVSACSSGASVDAATAYSSSVGGYEVTQVRLRTAAACASDAYQLTVSNAAGTRVAQLTGKLDSSGFASQDIAARHIAAADVSAYSVVVSG